MKIRMRSVLLAVGMVVLLSAPSAGASSAGPAMLQNLAITLEISKPIYGVGELVPIRIILKNQSSFPLVVRFPAGQHYELFVTTSTAQIWSLVRHGHVQITQAIVIDPRQVFVFEETWNQRTAQGLLVGPGTYQLSGWFKGFVAPLTSRRSLLPPAPQPGLLDRRAGRPVPALLTPPVRLPPVQFMVRR